MASTEVKRASVFSVYFENISQDVVNAQRECIKKFLPQDWTFLQVLHQPAQGDRYPHAHALEKCIEMSADDLIVFLDIDCIPLSKHAFLFLQEKVVLTGFAGAVQRANHINNNRHLYIGPFCMAITKTCYKELGSPSFCETTRGDAGEELTYKWEEKNYTGMGLKSKSVMWPFSSSNAIWDLDFGFKFGLGTAYGTIGLGELFYHSFNARDPHMQKVFVDKCYSVIQKEEKQCVLSVS